MMHFKSLSVQGFRSFAAEQNFALNSAPGLVYVTGDNKIEPELGANGVGKSSLFEALFWVLYGKTSFNLRAGDIANWSAVPCSVTLRFTNAGHDHELLRNWSPNVLRLDGEDTTQDRVVAALGLSEEAFLNAVFHAQFIPQFSDLTPAAQMEIFSDALRLQVWETAVDNAMRGVRDTKVLLQKLEVQIASDQASLREIRNTIEEQEQAGVQWLRQHVSKIKRLNTALRAVDDELRREVPIVGGDRDGLSKLETEFDMATTVYGEALSELKIIDSHLSGLHEGAERLQEQGTCPLCLQTINPRISRKLRNDSIGEWQRRRKKADSAVAAARDNMIAAKGRYNAALHDEQERKVKVATAKERRRSLEMQRDGLKQQLGIALAECDPFDTKRLDERAAASSLVLDDGLKRQQQQRDVLAHYDFWVDGFREIRLALVREALTQFEITTNSALSMLGLSEWAIEFDVEGELKSGKTARGFNVFVHSPYNEQRVPFAAWSGGERQRLRLAITLGLSDLIQDFLGVHSNIEVFDEPTAWLSEEGVSDLLDTLVQRAQDKTVFLIDHRSLDSGVASRIVTVTKTENGSVLE